MGRARKFDYEVLRGLLEEGKTTRECAEILGVSAPAISQARKKLGLNSTKVVAIEAAGEVVGEALDALGQIRKINTSANSILDLMMKWIGGDATALEGLAPEIRNGDPVTSALKAMGEIRNQLKLQLEIFQAVYDVKAAEEFQKEVITIIGEVDPDARTRIIARLREKQAIRQSVTLT